MEKMRGRPKGKGRTEADILMADQDSPVSGKRRPAAPPSTWTPRDNQTAGVTPRAKEPTATSCRPSFYLVGKCQTNLTNSKLPKTIHVLGRFLFHSENTSVLEAANLTALEVKAVWQHHFGPQLIMGKEIGTEAEKEAVKLIKSDRHIAEQVVKLSKKWRSLEQDSRRPDRSSRPTFQGKQDQFIADLDLPFSVAKADARKIIQHSGIKDWEEEWKYLQNQLSREQVGCLGCWDFRQKKRDNRKLKDVERSKGSVSASKSKEACADLISSKLQYERQSASDEVEMTDNDDEDYVAKGTKKKKKIDIMSKISVTADARNISLSDRTVMAAAVINALPGINIGDTNINRSTAWRMGKKMRLEKAEEIKEQFQCPEKVVVHWDGKTLGLKGRIVSKRVCVYLSGVDAENSRKLLGIPDCPSGKGVDEFEVVREHLVSWEIQKQIVGMVFDTTSSNSGKFAGACRYLEIWVDSPILWLACRRHVAELHVGAAMKEITGVTKEPGVCLFRRLRDHWYDLDINMEDLMTFDHTSLAPELQEKAENLLQWAQEQLAKGTFPRDDYREFMELVVITLGGKIEGFTFKLPGPDHHARWMSKCIYFLKIRLLRKVFVLTEEEQRQADNVVEFVLLMYAKYWFTTPLASSAARQDLELMSIVNKYRLVNPRLASVVLKSCNRHMWYITPQLVVLSLTDTGLDDDTKEQIARKLHSMERKEIRTGKPAFPVLPDDPTVARREMASLITSDSWLVFNILRMNGSQDWLLAPATFWPFSPEYKMLEEFTQNLVVVNDLAERGIHLASDYVKRVQSEEQRTALFQVVEDFRSRVQGTTKASLRLC